ncbi:hypothetical protein ACWGR4_13600 [Embleya sp. NPDC055664]
MRDPMPPHHRRDNTPAGAAGACHPRDPHTEILRVARIGVNLGDASIPVRGDHPATQRDFEIVRPAMGSMDREEFDRLTAIAESMHAPSNYKVEISDGTLVMTTGPSGIHEFIVRRLRMRIEQGIAGRPEYTARAAYAFGEDVPLPGFGFAVTTADFPTY